MVRDASRHYLPIETALADSGKSGCVDNVRNATRVAPNKDPWIGLYLLVSGKTVGGTDKSKARDERLRRDIRPSAWLHLSERGFVRRGRARKED